MSIGVTYKLVYGVAQQQKLLIKLLVDQVASWVLVVHGWGVRVVLCLCGCCFFFSFFLFKATCATMGSRVFERT
jgi:hypothetical protein